MIEQIGFYMLSTIIILASICVISLNNPVYNVLCLVISFLGTAGLYFLLNADFLGLSMIIIYVGAVAVFFLFIVMTLEGSGYKQEEKISWQKKALGIFLGVSFGLEIASIIIIKMNSLDFIKEDSLLTLKDLAISIFQDYVYLLELMGIILLIAMLGAIIIATHNMPIRQTLKKQKANKQNERSRENSVKIVKIEFGKGIK